MDIEDQIRIVCPAGGLILFSGAQMRLTVPNTSGLTRFCIDFRTVDLTELENGRGAPNVDTRATGISLRDFRRGSGDAAVPDHVVARYDSGEIPKVPFSCLSPTAMRAEPALKLPSLDHS
jgi:hypothetical protein